MKLNNPNYLNGSRSSVSEIDGRIIPIDTIALLRAMTYTPTTVWVSGYHTKNDGAFGSNIFRWNPTSTATDNGGTIIKLTSITTGRYELQYSGAVNVKWFGAKPYSNYEDAENAFGAFQNAFNVGKDVYIGDDEKYMCFQPNPSLVGALYIGLRPKANTKLFGGGTIDYSRQLNPLWASGIIEINSINNFHIDGIIFDGGASRPEANVIRGESSAVSIGKYNGNDNSSDISITNCIFKDIGYSGYVAEPRGHQKNWNFSNNTFYIDAPNKGIITSGAQHAWDILSTLGYESRSVSGCKINNNNIFCNNSTLGGGTAFKVIGLVESELKNNIVVSTLNGTGTTSSGDIEIVMKNSTISGNRINKLGVSGAIFMGVVGCSFYGNVFDKFIFRDIVWRTDDTTLSSSSNILDNEKINEFVSLSLSSDITIRNSTINKYSQSITYNMNISNTKIGIYANNLAEESNTTFYACKIEEMSIFNNTELTRIHISHSKINKLSSSLSSFFTIDKSDIYASVQIYGNANSVFNNSNIHSTVGAVSSGLVIRTVKFNNCDFYGSKLQTGSYIIHPSESAYLLNCRYHKKTIDNIAVTATGHINPIGVCTIIGDLSNFDKIEQYNIYDPNKYAKSSFNNMAPTNNTYEKYFRVYNFNASSSGDKLGWVCITAGTPGTWKAFGSIEA